MACAIVWFRQDLRLADNPALTAAAAHGLPVVPVYIHDPAASGDWAPGAASRWWLHRALTSLDHGLHVHHLHLVIRCGPASEALAALIVETAAVAVHWNRLYEPALINRDRDIKQRLRKQGVGAQSHNGRLLHEPWTITTGQDTAYQAFTPFWRTCRKRGEPAAPLVVPSMKTTNLPQGETIDGLELLPRIPWDDGLRETWTPGEDAAQRRLSGFLEHRVARYPENRETPSVAGTSGLSPHLHFGEISPRQIWHATAERLREANAEPGADTFLSEIGWREFAHHVLYHRPALPDQPLDERFSAFPWRNDDGSLERAWRRGQTGFPIVDAGMRELWATGWMHNRVRMVVGSLLVKNLRLPWQRGERWFWDTLVDADLANNSLGWQWVAGSGADAAPFFRIFNPVRQGERFDAHGDYVARWVPELAALPARHRQAPWQAPAKALQEAGVKLGRDYPEPIVDLKRTRGEALEAFQQIKRS